MFVTLNEVMKSAQPVINDHRPDIRSAGRRLRIVDDPSGDPTVEILAADPLHPIWTVERRITADSWEAINDFLAVVPNLTQAHREAVIAPRITGHAEPVFRSRRPH